MSAIMKFYTDRVLPIPKIRLNSPTNETWKDWKFRFVEEMRYFHLYHLISVKPPAEVLDDENFKQLNQTAIGQTGMCLNYQIRQTIITENTAYDMYLKLEANFEGAGETRCISALKAIHQLTTNRCEDLKTIVSTIKQAKAVFDKFDNDPTLIWRSIFITALPPKFHSLRTHLTQMNESDPEKKLEKFYDSAIIESQFENQDDKPQLMNNKISTSNSQTTCNYCHKPGHLKRNCLKRLRDIKSKQNNLTFRNKNNDQSASSSSTVSYNKQPYNKFNDQSTSSSRSNNKFRNNKLSKTSSNLQNELSDSDSNDDKNLFNASISCNAIHKKQAIFLDSGATDHFSPIQNNITTATADHFPVQSKASKLIYTTYNKTLKLNDIVICESLSANFLSVPKLCSKGF